MITQANTILRTCVNSIGQPIAYPRDGTPEVTALLLEMAPGEETGWHHHPVPLLGYILTGGISLESVDVIHNGVNEGATPCKMVVFVAGIKDLPFTVEDAR